MNVLRLGSVGLSGALTGDILGVTVDPEGWIASITVKGVSTGGTYVFGLGANNAVSGVGAAPKLIFTVVSKGHDDSGNATTITRTVYGVKALRKAYPNDAQNDEVVSGSDVVVRVILSDYVWVKDTDVTVSALSGFYTQGGNASRSAVGLACVNSNTVDYTKAIANWSWVPFEHLTGSDFKLRVVAFHRDGQSARPVRAVKFSATDGIHTVETTVTTPTIDSSMPDEVPVIEYVGTLSTSTLDQGAEITCNFIAYPWVGDSTNVVDSSTGVAAPSPLVGPIKMVCDKTGAYGTTKAKVDPVGGNDTTGTAYDSASYDYATAAAFATIGKAASAIAAYNNTNRSRNDVGAGQIDLVAGNYSWLGSSNSYGNVPKTWITITAGPGVSRSDVVINATSGNTDISDRVKIKGVKITTTGANTFSGIVGLWFDDCEFDTAGTTIWNTANAVMWFTHSSVTVLGMGMQGNVGTHNPALVRGNLFGPGFTKGIVCFTVLGNKKTGFAAGATMTLFEDTTSFTTPQAVNFIVAFNELYGMDNGTPTLKVGGQRANLVGGAIVQNIIEVAGNSFSSELGSFATAPEATNNTPVENFIIWHNTFVGARCFVGYNDQGSTIKYRRYWSQVNNYWDRWSNKGDTFGPGENGNRIGAWTITNNVGSSGNVLAECMNSLPGNFFAEFDGIHCYEPVAQENSTYAKFVNRESATETGGVISAGTGDGDYHLQADSPLIGMPIRLVLPYDIAGTARTLGDAAGAYTDP